MRKRATVTRRKQGRLAALASAVTVALLVMAAGLMVFGLILPSAPLEGGAEPGSTSGGGAIAADRVVAAPLELIVPSQDLTAPVIPIEVSEDRVLDPPRDPLQVGWWNASARPGEKSGQTVITGHTVHTGGGALDRVRDLHPLNTLEVSSVLGTVRYRIDKVAVYSRDEIATNAQELFGQDRRDNRLVLITCTDWNGSFYESNVIAFGTPVEAQSDGEPIPVSDSVPASIESVDRLFGRG